MVKTQKLEKKHKNIERQSGKTAKQEKGAVYPGHPQLAASMGINERKARGRPSTFKYPPTYAGGAENPDIYTNRLYRHSTVRVILGGEFVVQAVPKMRVSASEEPGG